MAGLGGTKSVSCVRGKVWRKETEAQCNVGHRVGILGGLGGRRVGWRVRLAGPGNSPIQAKGLMQRVTVSPSRDYG